MKKLPTRIFLIVLLSIRPARVLAQEPAAIDSMKMALANATGHAEKVYWYDNLCRTGLQQRVIILRTIFFASQSKVSSNTGLTFAQNEISDSC